MQGADVCAGSGRRVVAGRCPICRGPAEILLSRSARDTPAVLGWHLPWSGEAGVPSDAEWRALLRRRALGAVQSAVALAVRTQRSSARAAFLIGRTAPLESGGGPHEERTKALRAFSELELAARGAGRVAAEVASAGEMLDQVASVEETPIPVEPAPEPVDFVDPYTALRATAQTAVLAATMSACIGWATDSFEELADVQRHADGLTVVRALGEIRSAARDAEEVRTRTATAGRQLARAVGWESELPILLSRARSEAAEDSEGRWAAGA